jgi:hypothetical protein
VPQDLIDDLQEMIDEEPDNYLNCNRTTLCTARDYLKDYFKAETEGRLFILPKPMTTDDIETINNIGRILNNLDTMGKIKQSGN